MYYVIIWVDSFVLTNKTREYLREAEEFIEKYKKKYDVDMLEPEGLIISIAFNIY